MRGKIELRVLIDPDALVYVRERAEMRGVSRDEFIEYLIDSGMRRITADEDFEERLAIASAEVAEATRRAVREFDRSSNFRKKEG
jgi:hypothetical protein